METCALVFNSKRGEPILLSKLLRSITSPNTKIGFPSGNAAFMEDWDGVVTCKKISICSFRNIAIGTRNGIKCNCKYPENSHTINPSNDSIPHPECIPLVIDKLPVGFVFLPSQFLMAQAHDFAGILTTERLGDGFQDT